MVVMKPPKKNIIVKGSGSGGGRRICSAIAIDAPPSSLERVAGIRWGSVKLKGTRYEMEDDVVIIQSDNSIDGFSYAAVFDGHAGFSSVKFLREELYKEFVAALQSGQLLNGKDFKARKKALQEAFESADAKLLKRLCHDPGRLKFCQIVIGLMETMRFHYKKSGKLMKPVDGLLMEEFAGTYLYLVLLVTCVLRTRNRRCWRRE